MPSPVEIYTGEDSCYELSVPQFAIADAVWALMRVPYRIAALRLIRSAYRNENGQWASLADARIILSRICVSNGHTLT